MIDYNLLRRDSRRAVGLAALVTTLAIAGCATSSPGRRADAGAAAPRADAVPAHATAATAARALRPDAPKRYTVAPGDTLWNIAGRYLVAPWLWSGLWDTEAGGAGAPRLRPGDTLVLARGIDGRARLREERVERLSPRIREQPLAAAIPTIPYAAIRAFLNAPRLVSPRALETAPYVVAFDDAHMVAGAGATVYVRGANHAGPRRFTLVRDAGAYIDPDTGELLGRRAVPVGEVTLARRGAVATGVITSSDREALAGDRLLTIDARAMARDFHPHPPTQSVHARVISVQGGDRTVGQYQVVTLDSGREDGMTRGTVLAAYTAGSTATDPVNGNRVALPSRRAGELMIFKTARRVSFALVMNATRAIRVGDPVRAPSA